MPRRPSALSPDITELLVLRLLQDRPMYGYEIAQAVEARTGGALTLRESLLYPVLHALEADTLLKAERQSANGRPRIYYTLTSRGVRRLFELTDGWNRLGRAVAGVLRAA